jgi:hypothetical protein
LRNFKEVDVFLHDSFTTFISEITPDEKDIAAAREAHESVRKYLAGPDGLGAKYSDSFLAGSYARHTAISPVKDVDVICLTTYTTKDDPAVVLAHLRRVLSKNYKFDDTVANRRSVMVILDNTPLTMDIVPAIATGGRDNPIFVPDKGDNHTLKGWVRSNPHRHLTLAEQRNASSPKVRGAESYLSTVKMMRWWRHTQLPAKQRHPKGFVLEVMCLELMPMVGGEWAELVRATMNAIANKYGRYLGTGTAPMLDDPALPGEKIRTKMTAADFDVFLRNLDEARRAMEMAIASTDAAESARGYRKVFGDVFPLGGGGGKGTAATLPVAQRNIRNSPTFA